MERDLNILKDKKSNRDYVNAANALKVHEEVARRQTLGPNDAPPVPSLDGGNPLGLSTALIAKVEEQEAAVKKQHAIWKSELQKIGDAVEAQMLKAEEARAAILRGDPNVNLSQISLKLGKSELSSGDSALPALPRIRTDATGGATVVGVKKRGSSGPRRAKVKIPESMYGELAEAIGVLGMNEREAVEQGFVARHPEINIKEVRDLFVKMTNRKKPQFLPNHEKPGNSRSKCWFYLRPHFYEFASQADKDKYIGWEAAKAEDDVLFSEEVAKKEAKIKASRDKEKEKKRLKREAAGELPGKRGRKKKKIDEAAPAPAPSVALTAPVAPPPVALPLMVPTEPPPPAPTSESNMVI